MAESETNGRRISVSEATLDAALARLELRIYERLSRALETKANVVLADDLSRRLSQLESRTGHLEDHDAGVRIAQETIAALKSRYYKIAAVLSTGLLGETLYALDKHLL